MDKNLILFLKDKNGRVKIGVETGDICILSNEKPLLNEFYIDNCDDMFYLSEIIPEYNLNEINQITRCLNPNSLIWDDKINKKIIASTCKKFGIKDVDDELLKDIIKNYNK